MKNEENKVQKSVSGYVIGGVALGMISALIMMRILSPWLKANEGIWDNFSGVSNIFLTHDHLNILYWILCGTEVGGLFSYIAGWQDSADSKHGWLFLYVLIPLAVPVSAMFYKICGALVAAPVIGLAFICIKNHYFFSPKGSVLYILVNLAAWYMYLDRVKNTFDRKIYSSGFDLVMSTIFLVLGIAAFLIGGICLRNVLSPLAGWILTLMIPGYYEGSVFTFALMIAIPLFILIISVIFGFSVPAPLPEANMYSTTDREFSDKYGEKQEIRRSSYYGEESFIFNDENGRQHEIYRDTDDPDEYVDIHTGERYRKDYAGNFSRR